MSQYVIPPPSQSLVLTGDGKNQQGRRPRTPNPLTLISERLGMAVTILTVMDANVIAKVAI
jgi:hypothetical protein